MEGAWVVGEVFREVREVIGLVFWGRGQRGEVWREGGG